MLERPGKKTMLNERSLAEKSADLEIGVLRSEMDGLYEELKREGHRRRSILEYQIEFLEDRVAHLYRELYETDG